MFYGGRIRRSAKSRSHFRLGAVIWQIIILYVLQYLPFKNAYCYSLQSSFIDSDGCVGISQVTQIQWEHEWEHVCIQEACVATEFRALRSLNHSVAGCGPLIR